MSEMSTRSIQRSDFFACQPQDLFAALTLPSAIRAWWGAARAIIIPRPGGLFSAAWGDEEDAPAYVSAGIMRVFDPPHRLVISDFIYLSPTERLPFESDLTIEYVIMSVPDGTQLQITHDGFPMGPEADEFFQGCESGWGNSVDSLRAFVEQGAHE